MKTRRAVGLLFGLLVAAPSVFADEIRPALLEINERDGGWVEVTWKVPMRGNQVEDLTPVLPEFLEPLGAGSGQRVPGAWLEYRTYRNAGQTLTGATLRIDGLAALPTDVLIRVSLQDGTQHSAVLRSGNESFTIPEQATRVQLAVSYWQIGTIHILEGFDHLLFLLTLLLIVTGLWPLLKTVTAFTVAHSLTLALATLGIVNFPSAPTEAVISLSIMLLAVEAVRKSSGETTLSERFPWLIAFTFGLVHGLGFAGALSEIGVPQNEVPLALLMFNVGVETGQVMFVVAVSVLLAGLHKLHSRSGLLMARTTPYAIGGVAAFWTLQRINAFL
ncbi:MAG: HupE/UreJ family protein [Gammaproteobacteria bacterium]|nr:MAG: HupE/UreJ family protein [Gammaproteobacteria bacterium]TDJ47149.1 MAG: HupE/UreJ family protein [Gemmatimonadota bacterium]